MTTEVTTDNQSGWLAGFLAALIVAVALLAANSVATYTISGSQLTGMEGWPQPLGWITRVLAIESWPTHDSLEVRWVAWALGSAGLVGLTIMTRRRQGPCGTVRPVLVILAGVSVILLVLVAIRALFAAVPLVSFARTWQLALSLLWMLLLYVWTTRLAVEVLARTIAVSLAVLAGFGLLFCVQTLQAYPNWPAGNVLLLTTCCLAGVFLLGTWAYTQFIIAQRTQEPWDYLVGSLVAGMFVMMAIVLSMAGRRAGVLGLAAGAAFIVVVTLLRQADLAAAINPGRIRRIRAIALLAVLTALAAGAVLVPRLFSAGRWQSVRYRVELYRATASIMWDRPASFLVGVGPGHVGFDLTARMRPLHAEFPRLFHGQMADEVHSEPLQAVAELGLPLGLVYLVLPLGGLIGFAAAYRRTQEESRQLSILGAGAALAAALAAEATSMGMRHPGVSLLVWTLVGMGWACGAQAGAFGRLVRWRSDPSASDTARPQTARAWHPTWRWHPARWLQPAVDAFEQSRNRTIAGVAGIVISLVVLALAWEGMLAGGYLYQARQAWNAGRQSVEVNRLLSKPACMPTCGGWMAWKYLHGQASVALMSQAPTDATRAPLQTQARDVLGALIDVCPAYEQAPVWLCMTYKEQDKRRDLCECFFRYDPYDPEARQLQAYSLETAAPEQLKALRLGIRNGPVTDNIARFASRAVQDAAAQQLLTGWMVAARQALLQPDPAQWSDPLALESLRMAVVLAGQQGKVAEAHDLANQAATLRKYLSADPWRNRLEAVDTEIKLDQAWFGWLLRPESGRRHVAVLDQHLKDLVNGPSDTYSEQMAAQFVAMLRLSQSQSNDPLNEASQALYLSDPTIDRAALDRLLGSAYARLVTLMGRRVAASQIEAWTNRGRGLLGQRWKQALDAAAARGAAPWWLGVLGE